jgi:hypothetical protein
MESPSDRSQSYTPAIGDVEDAGPGRRRSLLQLMCGQAAEISPTLVITESKTPQNTGGHIKLKSC